jgi:hypothetical protein
MTIKIVLPEGGEARSSMGTRVFTSDGSEIKGVTRIQLDLRAGDYIEATITVAVGEVFGLDGVVPTLSRETHDQLEALGYKVER